MNYYQKISENFQQTIELIAMSVDSLAEPIEHGSKIMSDALLNDRKIIACGNGPDCAIAQLFVSNLLNRFEQERPALPALSLGLDASSLTAIATGNHTNDLFARQIHALGQTDDVLLCISSGNSHTNLLKAIQAAHERNMAVVAVSNNSGGQLTSLLTGVDIELAVSAQRQPRVVELHTMIIQCLCEMIELGLFGSNDQD